ncbi:hypothetical protein Gogos_008474 [Gossypium gossypioides]|uniref:Phosphoglycerate mutase-like protein 1 n=1 Tax=Gossypium gossypioides TaxID=34282 RepID=A0A7J9CBY4_GOSGO|nr:hypothetical protein [Gossypium gossypioides]
MKTTAAQFPYPWQRCKIIHLVRHGQAMHNVEGDKDRNALLSPHLFDAQLSPLGLQQVCKLRKEVHARGLFKRIELVVTSPLYSADEGNTDNFSAKPGGLDCPQIMAVELCRDRLGVRPCDMRRKVSECEALFPSIDFSMMDGEDDSMWNPDIREPEEEIAARMVLFMNWLWTRPEQEIVIVSHGIILQQILKVLGNDCHQAVSSALCQRPMAVESMLCSSRDVAKQPHVLREEVSN